jgi:ribonucleotide monophosphatase NagD (HAD superfamily)
MPVPDDDVVVTSAQAVARLVAADLPDGSAVLLVGGEGLRQPLEALGLRCVTGLDDEPAAVVQGFHPDVGWRQLAEASYAVAAGLPWYASNRDLTIPTPRGTAPGNGSLVQLVQNATGAEPVVAGKPERPLFDETLRRTGAQRPLMVGDRVDTDIDGATALGLPSLAVLTGVSDLAELAALEPGRRPAYVASDLRGLVEAHPEVVVDGDASRCGDARAVLRGDAVHLESGEPRATTSVRAVLGLAWEVGDTRGATVAVQDAPGLGG